ncbi:hypothetical protein CAPTEDRAFT_213569 [Capitella teleta]|uniref:G-protein coupled receptors family 1 profile domain-containing protein n=1 Tax=Capitella teleta TaxID=283909 RepID=R7VK03_CAPTE|nr:hypothetical protein CAPTEDRAFT_213569 [Capitella teleta]|eukprot:ELU16355.1 hypothetical protein CAPTEDRAFT_213569 [Capitella teleta]
MQEMVTYSPVAVDNSIRSVADASTSVTGVPAEYAFSSVLASSESITEKGITDIVERIYVVLVPAIVTFVVISGLLGNVLVIYVISSRKHLQTVTNILLMNLAISDVSFLLICGSFTAVYYVLPDWPLGDALCRIVQYLLYVSAYVTVYTLTAVSAVRYVTVLYGSKAVFIRSKRNIVLLAVGIWVVFLVAKIPILVVHGVSHNHLTQRTTCVISGVPEAQQLFASFFVFAYALPLVVIATLYLMIVCHLRRKGMHNSPSSDDRKRHITKVLVLVVAVFAVCWLPLHIHLLVAYYGQLPETVLYKVLLILWNTLAFLNSVLNPIIYNFCSQDFRLSFKEVVTCSSRLPPVADV